MEIQNLRKIVILCLLVGCAPAKHMVPYPPLPYPLPEPSRRPMLIAVSWTPLPPRTNFVTTNTPVPPLPIRWHTNTLYWDYYENLNALVQFNVWGSPDVRRVNSTLMASNLPGTARSYTYVVTNDSYFHNVSVQFINPQSIFTLP